MKTRGMLGSAAPANTFQATNMPTRKVRPTQEALKEEPKEMVSSLAKAASAKAEMKSKRGARKDNSSEKKKVQTEGKTGLGG